MFYYMVFHTSISAGKDIDKKTLTTFLYGSVLYIIFHALLNSSDRLFFKTIQSYFWIILTIDVVCMLYLYTNLIFTKTDSRTQANTFFDQLKHKLLLILDNFIDVSNYTNDVTLFNTMPAIQQQYQYQQHPQQHSQHQQSQQEQRPNTPHQQQLPIKRILKQPCVSFSDDEMIVPTPNNNSPEKQPASERDLIYDRYTTNIVPTEKPTTLPKELQSSSIAELRKKDLTQPVEAIDLDADTLIKNIYGNSTPGDDTTSVVSGTSDLGSVLDLDLTEFTQNI